mmetsp:Transcript_23405/g.35469  ORF Transcript_23405/g.35469 Transcript_23405/m.35469 type:complete len:578 (+) Transcript_23405:101-1834(+)
MMTVYNNNNDNDVNVKDLEKNGIESTNLTLTASNISGDSPTANNVVEGGSGPGDLSEASGNSSHGQDASSHGRNGRKMTIVLILGSLALAVATTADFDFFSKPNLLFSDKAKNGSIGLQVVGPERLSKKSENLQETFLNPRSLKKSESEVQVQCGDVVSWKVSLEENLVCDAPDGVPNSDAALTLDGPGAVLKCKGFKIVQSEGDASTCEALNEYEGNLEAEPSKVKFIKGNEGCGLPFLYGVKLLNGAKAVGCDIENFLVGAYVGQGAKELSDVTVSNNRYGVVVETNTTVKITDVTAKDNGQLGILASNDGTSIFVEEYKPGGSIALKDITASDNGGNGIEIQGDYSWGINIADKTLYLKNVKAENNNLHGIVIDHSHEIDLEEIDANGNGEDGISISASKNISLLKNIKANGNGGAGIHIISLTYLMGYFQHIEANNNVVGIRMQHWEMIWKGRISLDENLVNGFKMGGGIGPTNGTITISGELTVDDNANEGIYMGKISEFDVTIFIAEGASFSACGNGAIGRDIRNRDPNSSFTVAMAGDGTGTCVVGSTRGFKVTLPPECGSTCPDPARFF